MRIRDWSSDVCSSDLDLKLTEGASLLATDAEVKTLEALLAKRDDIDNYVAYVGTGSPRFYLPLDQQLPAANFAQFVVRADGTESRETLRRWLVEEVAPRFPELQLRVTRLESGPPVGSPDRKSVVSGRSVSVRVDLGGGRVMKKKNKPD